MFWDQTFANRTFLPMVIDHSDCTCKVPPYRFIKNAAERPLPMVKNDRSSIAGRRPKESEAFTFVFIKKRDGAKR